MHYTGYVKQSSDEEKNEIKQLYFKLLSMIQSNKTINLQGNHYVLW